MALGFHTFNFSEAELLVLQAFDEETDELMFPQLALQDHLSKKEVREAIASLRERQLVKGEYYLQLTKAGVRWKELWS
ncbi:MAG: hypothetical protein ABEK59_02140 [Halobacteria archaeon]